MKNSIVVGVLMLGLGFAIGWIAKPVPVSEEKPVAELSNRRPEPVSTNTAENSPAREPRPAREPVTKAASNAFAPTEAQMTQAKNMQSEMSKAMVKRMRTKFEQHIEKLAENLNLSAAQKSALIDSLDERMKKMEALDFTDPKSMEGMTDTLKEMTTEAIEAQLEPSLSEEQKTAFADFKDREHRGKVDTAALKSLSKLQGVVEFDEGQRDEVYKILLEDAEASASAKSDTPDVAKMMTEGMGIELDPYDLGLEKIMADSMGANASKLHTGSADEKKTAAQSMREAFNQQIDAKVERLKPVLNEKQLEQYRTELSTKGLGVYGPMINALDPGNP